MKTVKCRIVGISPISFSNVICEKRNTGEGADAFEERTWRKRLHVNSKGEVFIPPTAIKNCLADCAKYLSESVPGKGKATYTKHFEAGVMAVDEILLLDANGKPVKADDVAGDRRFVPSSGKKGDGKRVWKTFPIVSQWQAVAAFYLLDPLLCDKPEKVREYLEHAGKFIGLGRFRPRNGGFYGRFEVKEFETD